MKVKILFLLLFLSFGTFSYGQTDPNVWKSISPDSEEFSLELPESQYFEYKDDSEGKLTSANYEAKSNGNWFYIFSGEDFEQTPLNLLILFAKKNNAKPSKIKIDGFKGEKYSFFDSEGFSQNFITIKAFNRFYVFHILGFLENKEIVKRFFESIKLKSPNNLAKSETKTVTPEEKQTKKMVNPDLALTPSSGIVSGNGMGTGPGSGGGIGSGTGRGSGRGNGEGMGSGDGGSKKPPPPPKPVLPQTPMKLLTKPKPRYTELARYYNLSGTVMVRATFLANGKVGSVSPITRLPFGLTTSAIEAAKQILFEPPTRNGKPYPTSKRIQYRFTIY